MLILVIHVTESYKNYCRIQIALFFFQGSGPIELNEFIQMMKMIESQGLKSQVMKKKTLALTVTIDSFVSNYHKL